MQLQFYLSLFDSLIHAGVPNRLGSATVAWILLLLTPFIMPIEHKIDAQKARKRKKEK